MMPQVRAGKASWVDKDGFVRVRTKLPNKGAKNISMQFTRLGSKIENNIETERAILLRCSEGLNGSLGTATNCSKVFER